MDAEAERLERARAKQEAAAKRQRDTEAQARGSQQEAAKRALEAKARTKRNAEAAAKQRAVKDELSRPRREAEEAERAAAAAAEAQRTQEAEQREAAAAAAAATKAAEVANSPPQSDAQAGGSWLWVPDGGSSNIGAEGVAVSGNDTSASVAGAASGDPAQTDPPPPLPPPVVFDLSYTEPKRKPAPLAREPLALRVTGPGRQVRTVSMMTTSTGRQTKERVEQMTGIIRHGFRLITGQGGGPQLQDDAQLGHMFGSGGLAFLTLELRTEEQAEWIDFLEKSGEDADEELRHAPAHIKADYDVVLTAIAVSGRALEHAAPHLRDSRDLVLAAVRQEGNALEFAGEAHRADPAVVQEAVNQNPAALEFASEDLRLLFLAPTRKLDTMMSDMEKEAEEMCMPVEARPMISAYR